MTDDAVVNNVMSSCKRVSAMHSTPGPGVPPRYQTLEMGASPGANVSIYKHGIMAVFWRGGGRFVLSGSPHRGLQGFANEGLRRHAVGRDRVHMTAGLLGFVTQGNECADGLGHGIAGLPGCRIAGTLLPLRRSRISTISRSAVFLPTPGRRVNRAVSPSRIQRANSSASIPDRMVSASRAPTPLTLIRVRNRRRSSSVEKPNSR